MKDLKLVIVASTGGSVANELFKNIFFKSYIWAMISDRQCPALEKAKQHNIPVKCFFENNKHNFSNRLNTYLIENEIDYVISFYTKLFTGKLIKNYRNKIINLHPSILPSFKGLNAFTDAINFGTTYVGTTIHFIDEKMDEGKIIMQTVFPINPQVKINLVRHIIFQHQCKSLLQVIKWLTEERIQITDNRVTIRNAQYLDFEFSPNLDFADAINLNIPLLC